MAEDEEIVKTKEKIKEELKSEELTELIVVLLSFIILSGIFGYIGYSFCSDNNYDIQKGIVFGSLFPIGLALLKESNFGNGFTYITYTIIYIVGQEYIPTFVGIMLLFIIIGLFIANFIFILKKDRTEEINRVYKMRHCKIIRKKTYTNYTQCIPKTTYNDKTSIYDKIEDEYEYERCFKIISEEEYDLHDGLCEECFDETFCY